MPQLKGHVEELIARPGKFGMMHTVKIDNVFYGTKAAAAPVRVGDFVEFTAEQNARGFWDADVKSFKKIEEAATQAQPVAPAVAKAAWVPDKDRQSSIIHQSSRKDALEFVKLLISSGAMDVTKAKTGGAKIEMVELAVDKYTSRFIEDVERGSPPEHPTAEAKKTKEAPAQADFADDEIPF